jgi:hypothetical protein
MRRAGFQQEEKELFQEAWEAMLWQELLRVEYVTLLSMHLRLCYLWGLEQLTKRLQRLAEGLSQKAPPCPL